LENSGKIKEKMAHDLKRATTNTKT